MGVLLRYIPHVVTGLLFAIGGRSIEQAGGGIETAGEGVEEASKGVTYVIGALIVFEIVKFGIDQFSD